ncbi:MAG: hypothetical protein RIR26_2016 [Pseudomonadota bacterium]
MQGIAISSGLVVGRLAQVARSSNDVKAPLVIHSPDTEWQKYSDAQRKALQEIEHLRSQTNQHPEAMTDSPDDARVSRFVEKDSQDSEVIDSYQLLLADEVLTDKVRSLVFRESLDATSAVIQAFQDVRNVVRSMENQYLREKTLDLDACEDLLLSALNTSDTLKQKQWSHLKGRIVVIHHPTPQDIIRLYQVGVSGIVAECGSHLSHAAILARSFNIPTLFSASGIQTSGRNGQKVILDADNGTITLNPSRSEQRKAEARRAVELMIMQKLKSGALEAGRTREGSRIVILANADGPASGKTILSCGAEGIGLLRTEFLHVSETDNNGTPETPPESHLEYFFKVLAESMQPDWTTVRLLDCGGDKPFPKNHELSKAGTPPLSGSVFGLRGIRFLLAEQKILETQLRAIVRANVFGNIRILLPYVTDVREIQQVKVMLQSVWANLPEKERESLHFPKLGAMIETPAAVLMLDHFSSECDFLSIGSNDLTQHILCVERGQPETADLFNTFHPAVLRTLKQVVETRTRPDLHMCLCGELASDPLATELLIGMGFQQLSCRPSTIPLIKAIIRNTNEDEAKKIAEHVLRMSSADEITDFLHRRYRKKHGSLAFSVHSTERAS